MRKRSLTEPESLKKEPVATQFSLSLAALPVMEKGRPGDVEGEDPVDIFGADDAEILAHFSKLDPYLLDPKNHHAIADFLEPLVEIAKASRTALVAEEMSACASSLFGVMPRTPQLTQKLQKYKPLLEAMYLFSTKCVEDKKLITDFSRAATQPFVSDIIEEMFAQMKIEFRPIVERKITVPILSAIRQYFYCLCRLAYNKDFFKIDLKESETLDQENESETDCFYRVIELTVVNCSNRFVERDFVRLVARLKELRAWMIRDVIAALIKFKDTGNKEYIRVFVRRVKHILSQFSEHRPKPIDADHFGLIYEAVIDFSFSIYKDQLDLLTLPFLHIYLKVIQKELEKMIFYKKEIIDNMISSSKQKGRRQLECNYLKFSPEVEARMEGELMTFHYTGYKHIFDFTCYFSSFLLAQYAKMSGLGQQVNDVLKQSANSPRSARKENILFTQFQNDLLKKKEAWEDIYEGELVPRNADTKTVRLFAEDQESEKKKASDKSANALASRNGS